MFNLLFNLHRQKTFIICLSLLFPCSLIADQKYSAPDNIPDVRTVSAEEAIDFILNKPELIVIDSRKATEYQKGHIEGSINILNTRLKHEDLERIAPDKSTEILFYCNGSRCMRSADSINKAKGWGYKRLIWFRGGWKEWTEKRLPVVTQ